MALEVPERVVVCIEVPRGSRVKRSANGHIDYISPIPCPFNYGSISNLPSDDGEPLDAVVLGATLPLGDQQEWKVLGVAHFVDHGLRDDKIVCGTRAASDQEVKAVIRFFGRYAKIKSLLSLLLRRGPTRFEGWEPR
ncbi:MAG: inorganic pyrophosphatase [Kiritimatiellia bacterium]|jgi:inorganic pyrophosphatase